MKEMGTGMGTEGRLERSKGESRQDNIHLEPGTFHISNNNDGENFLKPPLLISGKSSNVGTITVTHDVHIIITGLQDL